MLGSRLWQLVGLVVLAAAFAYGLRAVSDGIRARDSRNVVTVTGSARQRVSSDYVIWDASVTAQAVSPASAARQLAGWTSAIRSYLVGAGVRGDELRSLSSRMRQLGREFSVQPPRCRAC